MNKIYLNIENIINKRKAKFLSGSRVRTVTVNWYKEWLGELVHAHQSASSSSSLHKLIVNRVQMGAVQT